MLRKGDHYDPRKGVFQLTEYDGERFLTATEVAKRFKISYNTCSSNVLPLLAQCHLPGRRRPVYKLAEVERISQVRVVEKPSGAVESVS